MWPVVAILDHAVFLNDISETFLYYLAELNKCPKYECCPYYNRTPNCRRQIILHTLHQLKINCPWVMYLGFILVIDGLQEFSNGRSSLHWRHKGRDGVSNQQPQGCLLKHLLGRRSKNTSNLRVTGLCAGNSPGTGEFPAQMASNAENVFIGWRHHV